MIATLVEVWGEVPEGREAFADFIGRTGDLQQLGDGRHSFLHGELVLRGPARPRIGHLMIQAHDLRFVFRLVEEQVRPIYAESTQLLNRAG